MAKKAVRRASPRGGINYNQTKADLEECVKNLEFKLETEGHELPRLTRLKFEKSLVLMKIGQSLINKVGCVGPVMSFEFRKLAATKARARRRSR